MEQPSNSAGTVTQSTLITLPVEVLVYIVSFLCTRGKVKIRYVCKRLRFISDVPSLWEEFTWLGYEQRDDRLLKSVLKVLGRHVKRLHFADHVAPSRLEGMLKFCKNVTHLSIATTI